MLAEHSIVDLEIGSLRAHVRVRGLHRLPHHIAELAGDRGPAAAGHPRGLDEHDLAAELRPCQSSGHADLGMPLCEFVLIRRQAEIRLEVVHIDGVHAHAEGLPALSDAAAVDTLARHMVVDARHLAIIQMWGESEEQRG